MWRRFVCWSIFRFEHHNHCNNTQYQNRPKNSHTALIGKVSHQRKNDAAKEDKGEDDKVHIGKHLSQLSADVCLLNHGKARHFKQTARKGKEKDQKSKHVYARVDQNDE